MGILLRFKAPLCPGRCREGGVFCLTTVASIRSGSRPFSQRRPADPTSLGNLPTHARALSTSAAICTNSTVGRTP